MMRAFVAGATGYTGREVVRLLVEAGVETIAHIRPDSGSRETWESKFPQMGALVSLAPWTSDGIQNEFSQRPPDLVFGLIGTTRARAKEASDKDRETYDVVDYGLTALLIDACGQCQPMPSFVYLSSLGVGPESASSYIQARWKVESKLSQSDLNYLIARPSFISGDGRDVARPMERVGALVSDGALSVLGLLGLKKTQAKYASMDNTQLACGLVHLSLAGFEHSVVEADEIRAATANK
jgi:nucleoside-diphosphate-sugar epimerase